MKPTGPHVSSDRMIHINLNEHAGAYGRKNPRTERSDSLAVRPKAVPGLVRDLVVGIMKGAARRGGD